MPGAAARAILLDAAHAGCVIHLSFEGLDPADRDELLGYPTSFSLAPEQVKKLIDAGRTLLARSADFQRLLRVLKREPALGLPRRGERSLLLV